MIWMAKENDMPQADWDEAERELRVEFRKEMRRLV